MLEKLKAAANYREFLQTYLTEKKISQSAFASQTGFNRGFPSDVLNGRRRLSLAATLKFEKALKVPAKGKKLFRYLVALENDDIFTDQNTAQISNAIELLKKSDWNAAVKDKNLDQIVAESKALLNTNDFAVYAAAGSPEIPATLKQIESRTSKSTIEVEASLKKLIDLNLISAENCKYKPNDFHSFFKSNDISETYKNLFKKNSQLAIQRVQEMTKNTDELFLTSFLCISEQNMPQLKKDLHALLLKYIDDSINESGDRVVKLTVALNR